jgi:hypothetical protein
MANDGKRLSPSLSQVNRRGKSPCDTPQTVRVRIFSAKSVLNAKGSITGGTFYFYVFVFFKFIFFSRVISKKENFSTEKERTKKYRKI